MKIIVYLMSLVLSMLPMENYISQFDLGVIDNLSREVSSNLTRFLKSV